MERNNKTNTRTVIKNSPFNLYKAMLKKQKKNKTQKIDKQMEMEKQMRRIAPINMQINRNIGK